MYDDYEPRLTAAEQKKRINRICKELSEDGVAINPLVAPERGQIAKSFWGRTWCQHLLAYQDAEYRLARGRSYLRWGAVISFSVDTPYVEAVVVGSELYNVRLKFEPFTKDQYGKLRNLTASLTSSVDLLAGRLPVGILENLPDSGLFPEPHELKPSCNCLDSAVLCKHVAATLYGLAIHFDQEPSVLFRLRGVDPNQLVAAELADSQTSEDAHLGEVFGIEMA